MTVNDRNGWIRACLLAFIAGAVLIAPLDFFHTRFGFQIYLTRNMFSITPWNWPVYIPLQFGAIAVVVMAGWSLLRIHVLDPYWGREPVSFFSRRCMMGIAVACVAAGYVLAWAVADSPDYSAWFVLLFIVSLVFVMATGSRHQGMAFLVVGLIGIFAEWLLLDPRIGYYAFKRPDWFGRSSTWLLPVYGWVGVFVNGLAHIIDGTGGRNTS
jgi:hypothetical protein